MRRENTKGLLPQTQEVIQKSLADVNYSMRFVDFDRFLLEHFLPEEDREEIRDVVPSEERMAVLRQRAYRRCYHLMEKNCPVARATLRSWFRIGASGRPSRNQMIAFAFALHLSVEELQEYFICGLQEPAIQVNDYQEMIFYYGLESGITYAECQDMIEVFERELSRDTVLAQNTHTDELWLWYESQKHLPKEDFLVGMCENGCYFKGYSKVALNSFVELKHEILGYIRGDAKGQLFDVLREKGFFIWAAENQVQEEDYGKEIPRFLHNIQRRKNQYQLDDYAKEEITRLSWIAYSSRDKNSDLLAELYASALTYEKSGMSYKKKLSNRKNFDLPECVYFMTDKYVSQLIGVAQQKEKEIRLSMARSSLMAEEPEAACPEWVRDCMLGYGLWKDTATVEETLRVLERALRQQKQRCQLVKRSDLLPLIHYVAQRRYEQQKKAGTDYVRQDALDIFTALANQIFSRCQMMRLDERYQLDCLFIATYGEEEMYSLSDVIEASVCQ